MRDRFIKSAKYWWPVLLLITIKLLAHFLTATNYQLQRDAYLYIELGKHLDWGFQSVPPFIGIMANLSRLLFGESTFGLRVLPALVGAASIWIIALMVREMKGGRFAQFLGGLAFLSSLAFLRSNSLFQPVSFNQFFWLLLSYCILKLINTGMSRYWFWIGIISGLAFQNKYSVLFFLFGFVVAILLTRQRTWLKTPYPWISTLIFLIIALPNIVWQIQNGLPVLQHMQELRETQLIHVSIPGFIMAQFLMSFATLLIWLPGLVFSLFIPRGRKYMVFGWIYIFTILVLILLRGKAYYTLGLYGMLFALGALAMERWMRSAYERVFLVTIIIVVNLFTLPYALPILKPQKMVAYGEKMIQLGIREPHRWEDGEYYPLPQDYADMIGWEELSGMAEKAYHGLAEEEKQHCTIFANNYGEAGAFNFYTKDEEIPRAISFDDSFITWAPDSVATKVLIKIGESDDLLDMYKHVDTVGTLQVQYARQFGTPVYLFREPESDVLAYYRSALESFRN